MPISVSTLEFSMLFSFGQYLTSFWRFAKFCDRSAKVFDFMNNTDKHIMRYVYNMKNVRTVKRERNGINIARRVLPILEYYYRLAERVSERERERES
jgi:hypothetical protein